MKVISDIDKQISSKTKLIVETVVVVLFVALSFFVAQYHEPWLDEAQSFLLGRDTRSIMELYRLMRYEETPILWFLIIKVFISLGGTYKYFYTLSIFFSTLGIALFEYKIKAPLFAKVMIPFTYFIAFQYTTITRSYTMVFLALLLIVILYRNSTKKPILYSLALLFLQQICAYTFIIAGSFYLLFIIDICKEKLYKKLTYILSVLFLFASFLVTAVGLIPANDNKYTSEELNIFIAISQAFYTSGKNLIISIVVALAVLGMFAYAISKRGKTALVRAGIILLPVLVFMQLISCKSWHIGILFLLMMSLVMIFDLWEVKYFSLFLLSVFAVQIVFTAISINYDYSNPMCGSKATSQRISQYVDANYFILGVGWKTTAIEAYFDHNIFENHTDEFAYLNWSIDFEDENVSSREFDTDRVIFVLDDDDVFFYIMRAEMIERGEIENHQDLPTTGVPKALFYQYFRTEDLSDIDFISNYFHVNSADAYAIESVNYYPGGLYYKDHSVEDNGMCVIVFKRQ